MKFLIALLSLTAAIANAETSPLAVQLKACIAQKIGAGDRSGYPADDWRAEVPGDQIVVDPNQVNYRKFDVDMWTTVANFSWATYRSTPSVIDAGVEILVQARQMGKMVRLTKQDGVASQGPFYSYPDAIKIEITNIDVPSDSDPVAAMLAACQKSPTQVAVPQNKTTR